MAFSWVTNNLGYKILSLALALTFWYYVQGELGRSNRSVPLSSSDQEAMMMAHVPIHARIVGEPAPGFAVVSDRVVVEPGTVAIVGRADWMAHSSGVWTDPVDVSRARSTRVYRVPVKFASALGGTREMVVTVTVPVTRQ